MFNIKLFPDFTGSMKDNGRETGLLETLIGVRRNCAAKYVNASFFDYGASGPESIHFLTYPTRWVSHYVTSFYSDVDPMFQIDFRTVSMIDWQDLYQSNAQAELFENFTDHGLGNNALTVVEPVEDEVLCVLSASFEIADDDWQSFKAESTGLLYHHAQKTGETYNRLFRHNRNSGYNITPREAECLYWVAMGKTDDQISHLLNIGKWTVNGYLQNAKLKMGTPSRSAAVARALVEGIISIRRAV